MAKVWLCIAFLLVPVRAGAAGFANAGYARYPYFSKVRIYTELPPNHSGRWSADFLRRIPPLVHDIYGRYPELPRWFQFPEIAGIPEVARIPDLKLPRELDLTEPVGDEGLVNLRKVLDMIGKEVDEHEVLPVVFIKSGMVGYMYSGFAMIGRAGPYSGFLGNKRPYSGFAVDMELIEEIERKTGTKLPKVPFALISADSSHFYDSAMARAVTLAHEMGHLMGLNHTGAYGNLMNLENRYEKDVREDASVPVPGLIEPQIQHIQNWLGYHQLHPAQKPRR